MPQNEAKKTAIFVQCLPKTIQGWRRPGYVCSVTMFLQLYLFDFKMPEFEFIHSFFHSANSVTAGFPAETYLGSRMRGGGLFER